VQRNPPTETTDRRQTSVVVVGILPVKEKSNFKLNYNDLEITAMRGQGPGGQNKNKVNSCIRVIHTPTGIQATVDERDQTTSKRKALEIVSERVEEYYQNLSNNKYNDNKKSQLGDSGRGDKIRTYNFIKGFVTDHRTGKTTNQIKKIMKGCFELIR
jgi:peptide chain release factor 1